MVALRLDVVGKLHQAVGVTRNAVAGETAVGTSILCAVSSAKL